MPIKYTIEESGRLVIATGTGTITGSDVLKHIYELEKDERYHSPMRKIVDYRGAEDLLISKDEAESISKLKGSSDRFNEEVCAFITPGDSTYGTARVHQSLIASKGIKIGVFKSLEEALGWVMKQKLRPHYTGET